MLWTRPIYTDFSGANYVLTRPYLGAPLTDFNQNWTVNVFIMLHRYMLFKMLKCKTGFLTSSLRYSIQSSLNSRLCYWRHEHQFLHVHYCSNSFINFDNILIPYVYISHFDNTCMIHCFLFKKANYIHDCRVPNCGQFSNFTATKS